MKRTRGGLDFPKGPWRAALFTPLLGFKLIQWKVLLGKPGGGLVLIHLLWTKIHLMHRVSRKFGQDLIFFPSYSDWLAWFVSSCCSPSPIFYCISSFFSSSHFLRSLEQKWVTIGKLSRPLAISAQWLPPSLNSFLHQLMPPSFRHVWPCLFQY